MDDSGRHLERLRQLIEDDQLVVVLGSGVAKAVCPEAPMWQALIENGIEACEAHGAKKTWCQRRRENLYSEDDPDDILHAAEGVKKTLCRPDEGPFKSWLRDVFLELKPSRPGIIKTVASWEVPLLTTNYDGLIEAVTGYGHVTWKDPHGSLEVVKGVKKDRRVLHLHGFWRDSDSIVLGIRSYEEAKRDEHLQMIQKAVGVMKTMLFVGCGPDGMSDPNIGNFVGWLKEFKGGDHYWLLREEEMVPRDSHLIPVCYGKKHSALPGFLSSVMGKTKTPSGFRRGKPKTRLTGLPRTVTAYLERLANETAYLELLGMGRSLQVKLPIADAYVPLRTVFASEIVAEKQERFREGEQEVPLRGVFEVASKLNLQGIVLLGEPGAGKTTGARQLAWRLSSRQALPEDLGLPPNMTPLFLRFRDLDRKFLAEEDGVLERFMARGTVANHAAEDERDPSADLLNGKAGDLLWILDGLDEVVDPLLRSKVSGWIRRAARQRPRDWFVVTCRFQGYFREGVPLGNDFATFHVRPLDIEQAKRFVRDWFQSAFGRLLLDEREAAERAREKSEGLLGILFGERCIDGHLVGLSTNPLLLTILCIVYHEEGELPNGRAELYQHCVMVMLGYWRRDLYKRKGESEVKPYDPEAARTVLAQVAWWLHEEEGRTEAPLAELEAVAERALAKVGPSAGLGGDGHAFVLRMRDEAGVLALASGGNCGFLHLSFQEYLAAEHAVVSGQAVFLAERAFHSWWQEIALLSLRQSQPYCESFFAAMVASGLPETHYELAARCLHEARYFAAEPFVAVLTDRDARPELRAAVARLVKARVKESPELKEALRQAEAFGDAASAMVIEEVVESDRAEGRGESRLVTEEKSGVVLVRIPAGKFMMGSENISGDERPVHEVSVSGFELGRYPVTNAQYRTFLEASGQNITPEEWDDRRFNQPEQPVVGISWEEAKAFCDWMGGRLPTEAEWEYACRAGSKGDFCFGDDVAELKDYGWFDKNSGNQTQPVGQMRANKWGVYDMHGNVWEWCADWYDGYSDRALDNPTGPKKGTGRVVRGGSWRGPAGYGRSAIRIGYSPSDRYNYLGFRVARSSILEGKKDT